MEMSERAAEVLRGLRETAPSVCDSSPDTIRAYCETVADLEHAEMQVRDGGTMIVAANGDVKPSPWVAIVDSRRRLLVQMAAALDISGERRAKKKKLFK